MKIGYLDCFAGISGDMFLSALLDAGFQRKDLIQALAKSGVHENELVIKETKRKGIRGLELEVVPEEHRHFHVADIQAILSDEALPEAVRNNAEKAFNLIIQAEAKVHGVDVSQVHLHEVSGLDTIVDILGVSWGIHLMGLVKILSSPLAIGSGTVKISHGVVPVPAPATVEILKGIPIEKSGLPGERVTPTGAALVATFVSGFGPMPAMTIDSIGYGAGARQDGDRANLLRILVGNEFAQPSVNSQHLIVLETNIDDQSPEITAYLAEKLMACQGVLDVTVTPLIMKKGRPGVTVSVLCEIGAMNGVRNILFSESSTLGVRYYSVNRELKERNIIPVQTPYGDVRVKISGSHASPEFEDCKILAEERGVPLREIFQATLKCVSKMRN